MLLLIATPPLAVSQFRTTVDVAVVDVTVVHPQGARRRSNRRRLRSDGGGQRRPVLAIDYIRLGGEPSEIAEEARATPNAASTMEQRRPRSRSVVFLLDDLSFKPQPAKSLGLTLERLLPLLGNRDLVGLTTTSGLGPAVTPTVDREPIAAALRRFAGRRDDTSAPFMIGIDEAIGSETRRGGADMVRRECDILALGGSCSGMVRAAARREAALAVRRTEEQLAAIRATISWMKNLDEPRVLILVSDGIAADVGNNLSDQPRSVSEAATSAAVQLYAITGVGD